ncbi:hypothetical protein DPMN_118209 [Dreissena polymorpha]|uniref:Uncharacterized protein n=1 Tax=Dreissena polymorpha TaxID=45954 RepID=A0A9D4GJQ6_DREPO|nr:hypothetical protein DPMN_118209 [Dreissena polymorpha]
MDRAALGKWSCMSRVEDRVDREAIVWRSDRHLLHDLYPIRLTSTRVILDRNTIHSTSIRFDVQICYPTATRPYTITSRLLFDHTRALYPIRSTSTRVILDRFVRL